MEEEKEIDEASSATQQGESDQTVESKDVRLKTKVAYNKLSGCDGTDYDEEGAVALLKERVEEGDCEAKWILGLCCEYGMGIKQDKERTELLYRESCEGGNAVGEFLLKNDKGGRGSGMMKVDGL